MNATDLRAVGIEPLQRRAFWIGGVGAVLFVGGSMTSPEQFFRSYLLAYLFWLAVPLGCLGILMLHHLVGGAWGFVIRRLLESAARTLPLMGLLFVPLLFGLEDLYLWARPQAVAADEVLKHKSSYLNVPFFVVRVAVYFSLWAGAAYLLSRWSEEQDRAGEAVFRARLQRLSAPGLLLYVLTASFAAIDWVMSLEPHWFSTIYGVLAMVGHGLASLAFVTLILAFLATREPLSSVLQRDHFHDLGNLILAFVMLWAYMAFSQYLIIWSGNLPEEIHWYLRRTQRGWEWIALMLVVFHFAVPFLLLLSRRSKRNVAALAWVATGLLVMRLIDMIWLVVPAFAPAGIRIHWLDIMGPIALGGLWIGLFLKRVRSSPLLPLHDPRWEDLRGHG